MKRGFTVLMALLLPLVVVASLGGHSFAQTTSRTFTETGKTVKGKFLDYWNSHGGLAQQGGYARCTVLRTDILALNSSSIFSLRSAGKQL